MVSASYIFTSIPHNVLTLVPAGVQECLADPGICVEEGDKSALGFKEGINQPVRTMFARIRPFAANSSKLNTTRYKYGSNRHR